MMNLGRPMLAHRRKPESRTFFSYGAVALFVAVLLGLLFSANPTAGLVLAAQTAGSPGQGSPPVPPAATTTIPSVKPASDTTGVPPGFRIGAGDVLQINVWREPEASVSVMVRPDGKISLPLVKELYVLGLTPVELEKLLTAKLEASIRAADVTVVVKEIHSKKVYLIGAVKKEGAMPLLSDMTILQVLSEAGGLTDYAKSKKIYVLRPDQNGKQQRLSFNYDAVIKGEHVEQNIQVLPDDTIIVPH